MDHCAATSVTLADLPADDALRACVTAVIERAGNSDGVAALSEAFLTALGDGSKNHVHIVARSDAGVVGVAALAPDGSAELAVDPAARRQGTGEALARRVLSARGDAGLWAHGNLPAARALAAKLDLHSTRELLVMEVSGPDLTAIGHPGAAAAALSAASTIPATAARAANETSGPDITLGIKEVSYPDSVAKWGHKVVDEQWLAVNNDAFSWHPEQGGWSIEQLRSARQASWFDPCGVRFLWAMKQDGAPQLAGFHWTKRHSASVGEVYVVGLATAFRGAGLGDPLMRAGLEHLVAGGAQKVILYVEADNVPAVARYREMGFVVRERHVVYTSSFTRRDT